MGACSSDTTSAEASAPVALVKAQAQNVGPFEIKIDHCGGGREMGRFDLPSELVVAIDFKNTTDQEQEFKPEMIEATSPSGQILPGEPMELEGLEPVRLVPGGTAKGRVRFNRLEEGTYKVVVETSATTTGTMECVLDPDEIG